MSDLETKAKIINTARILFADRGYEGTSVREIARTAEVNVASLNYHFASKENLFLEILKSGYIECSEQMRMLLEKNKGDLENTMVDFFRYFIENSPLLISHFKLMMSSQHSHNITSEGTEDGTYGPPGGMIIADVLRKLCPDCSDEDLHWALKSLFTQCTHLALIHSCCMKTNKNIPYSSREDLETSIRRMTRMIVTELKHPQHKTSNP
jgi:AcrR family transcriptional regulator